MSQINITNLLRFGALRVSYRVQSQAGICIGEWQEKTLLNYENTGINGMQKIADMTGVPLEKAHPHSLRHLFALTYIDTYNNIGELADILGHSSLEITRIYLSSSREEKRNKMNRLNL